MKKRILLWLFAGLVLLVGNYVIIEKEALIANGRVLYLQLAPVDPRSLMQGDYMRLRYGLTENIELPDRGYLVIRIDEKNVGHFVRIYKEGSKLGDGEYLLKYKFRNRWEGAQIGAQSFFFQEGMARKFNDAEYAELRLADDGTVVLVAMRDESLELLGEVQR